MVLLVVKFHDFPANCGFQGGIFVGELWEGVLGAADGGAVLGGFNFIIVS